MKLRISQDEHEPSKRSVLGAAAMMRHHGFLTLEEGRNMHCLRTVVQLRCRRAASGPYLQLCLVGGKGIKDGWSGTPVAMRWTKIGEVGGEICKNVIRSWRLIVKLYNSLVSLKC